MRKIVARSLVGVLVGVYRLRNEQVFDGNFSGLLKSVVLILFTTNLICSNVC